MRVFPRLRKIATAQQQGEIELLSLHKEERRAHFEHDVNFLVAHVAPQLLDVRDGQVNRMSREDVRAEFVEYFKSAQFLAWDDVESPIVGFESHSLRQYLIDSIALT